MRENSLQQYLNYRFSLKACSHTLFPIGGLLLCKVCECWSFRDSPRKVCELEKYL